MTAPAPYLRPDTLPEALDALATGEFRIAAGCTDLFPATERKALEGPILDITAIDSLRGIDVTTQGVRIGALTTWRDVIDTPLPAAFDGLKQAAAEVGAHQIQNRGTVAGNLCNASPAADGVPPLLTLSASVELTSSAGTRTTPLEQFIKGPRQVDLRPGEVVSAILIPQEATAGQSHFRKLGARKYLVISIAMVAARLELDGTTVSAARIAVGACGPVATRLPAAEARLVGHALDPDRIREMDVAASLSPIADMRADAAYRLHAAADLVRRTVAGISAGGHLS